MKIPETLLDSLLDYLSNRATTGDGAAEELLEELEMLRVDRYEIPSQIHADMSLYELKQLRQSQQESQQ